MFRGIQGSQNRDLEQLWCERVEAARIRYNEARDAAAAALIDWRNGKLPQSDGGFALHNANAAELDALRRYKRAVQVFRNLIVHGESPGE